MHVVIVAEFRVSEGDGPPDLDVLRRVLGERARREPGLCSRVVRRTLRRPVLIRARELAVEDHVRSIGELDAQGLGARALRDRILATPLDPNRPLWEIWLDPDEDEPHVFRLLIKLHHALVDGAAAVALLERLLGGIDHAPASPLGLERADRARPTEIRGGAIRQIAGFVRDHLKHSPPSRLNGGVEQTRHHRELRFDGAALARARTRLGVSGNDVLVAAVAGAMRRWLAPDETNQSKDGLRAFCPVSLRAPGERRPTGNQISPWFVPLPVSEASRSARVRQVHEATSALKRRGAARGGAGMALLVHRLGPWLAWLGMSIAAWRRAFNVVVTNLPGPREPLVLLGARMISLRAHPPLFPGQRLAVSIVHYDGQLVIGLIDGWPEEVPGHDFSVALAEELDALIYDQSESEIEERQAHAASTAQSIPHPHKAGRVPAARTPEGACSPVPTAVPAAP